MAHYEIDVEYDQEFQSIWLQLDGRIVSEIDFLRGGDKLTFNNILNASDLRVSGFHPDWWTETGSIYDGQPVLRRHVGDGETDWLTVYSNGKSKSFKTIARAKDTTPDSFSFSNQTNLNPKGTGSVTTTISGMNAFAPVEVTYSDGQSDSNMNPPFCENGSLTVYFKTPNDYNQTLTVTVKVGTRSSSFTVKTRRWPLVDQVINFPHNGPDIKASTISNFFGYEGSQPSLSEFTRGGGLVPSIQQNEQIATGAGLKMSQFAGSASALYFIYRPPYKRVLKNTLASAQAGSLVWNILDDYTVGYGATARDLEYRYTVSRNDSFDNFVFGSRTGNPGSWSPNNSWVSLGGSAPRNSERIFTGTLHIHVRNREDNSLYITTNVPYDIAFYGP